jgi:hypothetical protein
MSTDTLPESFLSQQSEHVIMSDGLSIDLGEESTLDQFLLIDDKSFVCIFRRIKSLKGNAWEIELEVPGLDLDSLVDFNILSFAYNGVKFICKEEFEFSKNDTFQSILILNAKRVITNHE